MSATEDKFRAALSSIAAEIADHSAPPLRLPPRRPGPRWSTRWLAPVAAAASVAAVAAGVLVAAQLSGHRTMARPTAVGEVPPYYVALHVLDARCCSKGLPFAPRADAVVRATATGAVIATVKVPRHYVTFVAVSGAADDRTFVLAAEPPALTHYDTRAPVNRFFLLRINPAAATASQRTTLTALPLPEVPKNQYLYDMALSPDGSKLAVTTGMPLARTRLHVYTMATGARRTWQGSFGVTQRYCCLSWAADSTTLQLIGGDSTGYGLLLLDTAKPGSHLVANSFLVNHPRNNSWRATAISGNGQTLVLVHGFARGQFYYDRPEMMVARTAQITTYLNPTAIHTHDLRIAWASQTGNVLIITGAGPHNTGAGIYTGHHYTPIPWHPNLSNPNLSTAAW